ncbi:MAG: ABC transporter transmembrane domain-containing protein [Fimbriimonadaceae bacterium]
MVGAWAFTLAIAAVMQIVNGRMNTYLGSHIASDLRKETYAAIERLHLAYFDRKPVGAIASRVTQDTDRVWFFLRMAVPFFLVHGLMLIAVTVILFKINWLLALAILTPIRSLLSSACGREADLEPVLPGEPEDGAGSYAPQRV